MARAGSNRGTVTASACTGRRTAGRRTTADPTTIASAWDRRLCNTAVRFESKLSVFLNRDFDDGGSRANLTFRYRNEPFSAGAPIHVGEALANSPGVYQLCAVPISIGNNAKPITALIKIWSGRALSWSQSYDFPITKKLAWSPDHRELLVELGRAMDDVFATPLHGAGVVPVAVPDELRAKTLRADVDYTVQVRIRERRAGASIELVELDERTGGSWTPVWTSPARSRSP